MLVVLGSQLMPRAMERMGTVREEAFRSPWLFALPPAWFAHVDLVLTGHVSATSIALAGCGVAVTAFGLIAAFGKLARDYETGLQVLHDVPVAAAPRRARRRLLERLADAPPLRWWLRDPVVRASFLLTSAYLVRDRDVKLRVFPGIAPMLVMPLFMLFSGRARGESGLHDFSISFAGSFLAIAPVLALGLMQYSRQWAAAEIFRTVPLAGPAPLARGMRRAVAVVLAPGLLATIAIAAVMIRRDPARLVLFAPGVILLPVLALLPTSSRNSVPLSVPPEAAKSAGRGLVMFGSMMLAMAIAAVGAAAWSGGWFGAFLLVEAALAALAFVLLHRAAERAEWSALE
jgi:hypothetical protein